MSEANDTRWARARVVVYARVSTDAQERDGTSLDTQEQACLAYAERSGWRVAEVIRDSASGYTLDRPGIQRVRQLLRASEVEVLLAYAVDRVARNQFKLASFLDEAEDCGVRLEFVTERFDETPVGRLILAVKAFKAEQEREDIRERTMRGKVATARAGKIPQGYGKGIYGYIYEPSRQQRRIHPEQAAIIRRIFAEFTGGRSQLQIANRLNQDGISTLSGAPWHPMTLRHILSNPAYVGKTYYGRRTTTKIRDPKTGKSRRRVTLQPADEWVEIPGATPAIVDQSTFDRATALLGDPERVRRGQSKYQYALVGAVRCRDCGRAMVGQNIQGKWRYYRCSRAYAGIKADRCHSVYVRADLLEETVRREAGRLLADDSMILAELRRRNGEEHPDGTANAEHEVARLDSQRKRLAKLYEMGEIDDAYLERQLTALRSRRAEVEKRLVPRQQLREPSREELRAAREQVKRLIDQADEDQLTLIVEALSIKVTVGKNAGTMAGELPPLSPSEEISQCA